MKIFLYVDNYSPKGDDFTYGGIRKVIDGFATALAACGSEIIVLCEGSQDSIFTTKSGYKIACFRKNKIEGMFAISPGLKQYICEYAKDNLVILNGIFHKRVYAFSRFLKKKVYLILWLLTIHTTRQFLKEMHI